MLSERDLFLSSRAPSSVMGGMNGIKQAVI